MKNQFKGYYQPSEDEIKDVWDNCVFVFDTNFLFDFYRYSDETVEIFFQIVESIKERLWIPFWVGQEYHDGLEDKIKQQVEKYSDTIKDLSQFSTKIKSQREHPFLSEELQSEIDEFYQKFETELEHQKEKLKELITNNHVKERIANLIGENIGKRFSLEDKKKISEEGDKRLSEKIPPGYIDYKTKMNSPGLRKYGDYIIWYEIINHFKTIQKPLIFVTFDTKEDWFRILKYNKNKIRLGPRPELIEEFNNEVNNNMWIYSTVKFIEKAENYLPLEEIDHEKFSKAKEEAEQGSGSGSASDFDHFDFDDVVNQSEDENFSDDDSSGSQNQIFTQGGTTESSNDNQQDNC